MTSHFSDIEALADDIEGISPSRKLPRPMVLLGSGFRSVVVRDANGTVYLIGRIGSVAKGYRFEIGLLPLIGNHLPNTVPDPQMMSDPTERFPGGVLTYPGLSGRTMRQSDVDSDGWEHLAADLGRFLAALHRIPVSVVATLDQRPSLTSRLDFEAIWAETSTTLQNHLASGEMSRLEDWWKSRVVEPGTSDYAAVITHHDFWYENLLVDGDPPRLTGVLDWEHARLSDPVADMVPLWYLGLRFTNEVINAYKDHGGKIDNDFNARFAKYRVLREFGGIQYSIRHKDGPELIASIEKLRQTGVTEGRP